MNKIAFMTLGCKVNQADTASMQELFRQAGYTVCDFTEEADVYVVNTCVVTNTGQQKSRQMIRRAIRKENDALIVVTGCYPQTAAEEVKAIDGVDLIIGTQDRAKIVTLVEAALDRKQAMKRASEVSDSVAERIIADADSNEQAIVQKQFVQLRTSAVDDEVRPWEQGVRFEEMSGGNEADKTRAYLKIQEGCNQYCSYCIIPYARGPIRSRSLQSIKEEVQRLTKAGYREIVLIGIHLGCYGKETKDGTTLYDAVRAALSVPDLQRLRLGSLESVEVEPRLLDLMAEDKRLCPHLHLPLQSGCDKVLKDMHRPYDTKRFATLLEQIRNKVPGVAITTDVAHLPVLQTKRHTGGSKAGPDSGGRKEIPGGKTGRAGPRNAAGIFCTKCGNKSCGAGGTTDNNRQENHRMCRGFNGKLHPGGIPRRSGFVR